MTPGFDDVLAEYLGTQTDAFDIQAIVRRFWLFDFDGVPVRVWQGHGPVWDVDGTQWFGTIDAGDTDHLSVPAISDGRDGASAKLEFRLGYLDAETYALLKADQGLVKGRRLTGYAGIFRVGEGLRMGVALKFQRRLTMQHARFDEHADIDKSGTVMRRFSASVIAKNDNAGRSQAPRLTFTPEGQRRHAARLGVAEDKGADFVPALANRTYQVTN